MIAFSVLTPESSLYEGKIQKATFPGEAGEFQVLQNHGSLISVLREGDIILTTELNEEIILPIPKSIVMIENNTIIVLVF